MLRAKNQTFSFLVVGRNFNARGGRATRPSPPPATPMKIINDSGHGRGLLQHGIHHGKPRQIMGHLSRKTGIPNEIPNGYILCTGVKCFYCQSCYRQQCVL
jgi:hypothetical protein